MTHPAEGNHIWPKVESFTPEEPEATRPSVQQAQDKAIETKDQVQAQVKTAAESQKKQAASELNTVAQAIRTGGQELRDQDRETVAHYTEKVADQIEQVSRYIDERNVDQLVADAADFARRRPEIFLGGAFMLGLAMGRFFTSSGGGQTSSYNYQPVDSPARRVAKYTTTYPPRRNRKPRDFDRNY
ncbi:MAG TPA: hypothetical protein P5526_15450 [Anaerolineae bacterium]|nr:hypothetical protein [Anaerolineae bacterium]MCB0181228.1 hypothetical protein [Anaerolineae bacterium]MCB0224933.1 hypothetical protein [Anaerolineae bacterium]MCB9103867.1 hypothetical protein [Anaerolineales bacterium]HRV93555.1 hypothetical protein [Anaerolineae bacterium]